MEWLEVFPDVDPPTRLRLVAGPVRPLGTLEQLGLEWQLDAVLCTEASFDEVHHVRPAVAVRPRVRAPLASDRVRESFLGWLEAVASARRPLEAMADTPVDDAQALLRGPDRLPDALDLSEAYWDNHLALRDQAIALAGPSPDPARLDALLADYPFVVAALDHPKTNWDRRRPLRKPVGIDAQSRVGPRPTAGRPSGSHPPHLASEFLRVLPDGRSKAIRRHRLPRGLPSPAPYWAIRVVQTGPSVHPLIQEARAWVGPITRPEAAVTRLATYHRNWKQQVGRGRPARGGGTLPRGITPYICPDLSVLRRKVPAHILRDPALMDALLADWVGSYRCARMLRICAGNQVDRLTLGAMMTRPVGTTRTAG